jgi:hypothetical protein
MTHLIPVAQWIWNLYRVTYHLDENDMTPRLTRQLVTPDPQSEVCGDFSEWPSPSYTYARWELIREDVGRPRQIGTIYGARIDESGWAAGEREAEKVPEPA